MTRYKWIGATMACLLTAVAFGGGFGGRGAPPRPAPRPVAHPAMPNLGHPQPRPVNVQQRPVVVRQQPVVVARPSGGLRPAVNPQTIGLASRPGVNQPTVIARPGVSTPSLNNVHPGMRAAIPSPGAVGGFLGMDKQVRAATVPAVAKLTNPGIVGRQVNLADMRVANNTAVNRRPAWVNLNNDRLSNVNRRWQDQVVGLHNWHAAHPDQVARWNLWATAIRNQWWLHHLHPEWFGEAWWQNHRHGWGGWHYGHAFNRHPWHYWWSISDWRTLEAWFLWQNRPVAVWTQPAYYDFSPEGNVIVGEDFVTVNGEPIATPDEFAQNAADVATVAGPANEEAAAKEEWLPLGTFAVSGDPKDLEPARIVQLAVSKNGIVAGTLFNTKTDKAQTIQGQVDKLTQRVALRLGDSDNIIFETGLFNLTQNEVPVLVHFGSEKVENYLLVRLEHPDNAGKK